MTFNELVALLQAAPDLRARFVAFKAESLAPITQIGDPSKLMIVEFEKNRGGRALAIALALLLAKPAKAIDLLRRGGVFRVSRYGYRAAPVRAVIADLCAPATGLSSGDIAYLQSVLAVCSLAEDIRALRDSVVARLRKRSSTVVKTLLALLDHAFTVSRGLSTNNSDEIGYYCNEEIAEATSLLLHLFTSSVGLASDHFAKVDETVLNDSGFYDGLIVDAAKIAEFHSSEVLIDAFPYVAVRDGSAMRVASKEPWLEKSVRLGYIQTAMQQFLLGRPIVADRQLPDANGASIWRLAKDMLDRLGERLVVLKTTPVIYFSLQLLVAPPFVSLFSSDELFLEDAVHLHGLGKEDYLRADEITTARIRDDITVMDVLKLQRFIYFVHQCYVAALADYVLPNADAVRLRSSVLVLKETSWWLMVKEILPQHKAVALTNLLTCSLDGRSKIDLQYTPILRVGGLLVFAPGVFAGSNLVRNLLTRESARLPMFKVRDPMVHALTEALVSAGFATAEHVRVRGKEIDIVAYRDGHFFIFECKNAFHPCSLFELRTSYEHVLEGADQLNVRKAVLLDPGAKKELFRNQGWAFSDNIQVHTAIICGNRLFNGYICQGHPVRHAHQLINLLTEGSFMLDDVHYRLWKADTLSLDDVLAYFDGSSLIADFDAGLQPFQRDYRLGKSVLSFSTYTFDAEIYKARVTGKYPTMSTVTATDDASATTGS